MDNPELELLAGEHWKYTEGIIRRMLTSGLADDIFYR